ncbi:FadR/GntR family transcriptional regulator [Brevibacillus massiliensis]|jgi:DNA-binding FadR family transcriptional regulator|uniref:FadR/GntR family transcriptional regulator n=1 Tax=Brevibacillus massiliensis TaxID=1118054 RepID=UPI0002FDCF2C|nr:FadR/GntR family transcriptional regulator [Brevibacillus massiliensis]
MFSSIGQSKAFLEIAQEIKKNIESGKYQVGTRLPAERALAETFQTSRATVREALRALEIIGVIESRVGQGTFVKTSSFSGAEGLFSEIANQTSPTEVFEARFSIEPYLTELAALRATQDDLNVLKNCLEQTEAALGNISEFEKLDAQFHQGIALAAKNSLLLNMITLINNVRMEKLWGTLKERSLTADRMKKYHQDHIEIYQAIRERDASKAKQRILSHIKTVKSNMLGE